MSASVELAAKPVEIHRLCGQPPRKLAAMCCGAICNRQDARSPREQVSGGQLAHLPRADEHHVAAVQVVEHLLRERCSGRGDRGRALTDRGLDARPATRVQRLAEDPVEQRPGRAGLVRRPHLPEDLPLARNQRVQSGRHPEEVKRSGLVGKPVQHRGDLVAALPCKCEQSPACLDVELVILDRSQVDLGAVAGRENYCFLVDGQRARQLGGGVHLDSDPLAQLDRRPMVRDPDQGQLHCRGSSHTLTTRNA